MALSPQPSFFVFLPPAYYYAGTLRHCCGIAPMAVANYAGSAPHQNTIPCCSSPTGRLRQRARLCCSRDCPVRPPQGPAGREHPTEPGKALAGGYPAMALCNSTRADKPGRVQWCGQPPRQSFPKSSGGINSADQDSPRASGGGNALPSLAPLQRPPQVFLAPAGNTAAGSFAQGKITSGQLKQVGNPLAPSLELVIKAAPFVAP